MRKTTWIGAALVLALVGCGGGASNELPEEFRGTFEMTRLLGTDNAMLTVGPTGITMAGCDINCPRPSLTFTSVTCADDTCTVAGPECTGTIQLWTVSGRSLEIDLTVVPGATGEAATERQVDCFQYSGSTESAAS